VVELGEDLGLGQVDRDVLGACDPLGVGHLDRHRPAERVVLGQVDRPEPASTQELDYPVAADGRGKATDVFHRVGSLDLTPLHCGLGQEIHRLEIG
jgi:hypothetical protein